MAESLIDGIAPDDREIREVGAEIARGDRLDRDLAERLGTGGPQRHGEGDTYFAALRSRPVLRDAAERRLIAQAKAGDALARAQLVETYMPLIARMARNYRTGHVHRQELLQEGVVGLLRAVERFEPDRDVPFWGYASWWVRQAMQQLVAELTGPVVLSDRALRHLSRLRQLYQEQLRASGREPTLAELIEGSGLGADHIGDLLAAERGRSLEEPVYGAEGEIGTLGEQLLDPDAEVEYERVLAAIAIDGLHDMLAGLSERERRVLTLRRGLDGHEHSLREVGGLLGVSGERVRQIERRALAKLSARALHPGADQEARSRRAAPSE